MWVWHAVCQTWRCWKPSRLRLRRARLKQRCEPRAHPRLRSSPTRASLLCSCVLCCATTSSSTRTSCKSTSYHHALAAVPADTTGALVCIVAPASAELHVLLDDASLDAVSARLAAGTGLKMVVATSRNGLGVGYVRDARSTSGATTSLLTAGSVGNTDAAPTAAAPTNSAAACPMRDERGRGAAAGTGVRAGGLGLPLASLSATLRLPQPFAPKGRSGSD